jgi:hypothetical protein
VVPPLQNREPPTQARKPNTVAPKKNEEGLACKKAETNQSAVAPQTQSSELPQLETEEMRALLQMFRFISFVHVDWVQGCEVEVGVVYAWLQNMLSTPLWRSLSRVRHYPVLVVPKRELRRALQDIRQKAEKEMRPEGSSADTEDGSGCVTEFKRALELVMQRRPTSDVRIFSHLLKMQPESWIEDVLKES